MYSHLLEVHKYHFNEFIYCSCQIFLGSDGILFKAKPSRILYKYYEELKDIIYSSTNTSVYLKTLEFEG